MERLVRGYEQRSLRNFRDRMRRQAGSFEPDEQMEKLLELRQRRPEAFDALTVQTRMAVGLYEGQKAAAELVKTKGGQS